MSHSSFIQLLLIRFREFIREPGIVFWSVIFPVGMAWVLGIAFSKQGELVQQVALIRNDNCQNPTLIEFLDDAEKTTAEDGSVHYDKIIPNEKMGKTSFKFLCTSWDEGLKMIKRGQANLMVREYPDSLEYYFDPASPQAKMVYITLSSAMNDSERVFATAGIRPLTQQGNRYIDFLIPGLIAMGVMNSLLWGISYALIEMRSKKLLRRMIATPMKKSEFLISHFAARLTLTIIETALLFTFAWFYFRISVQGSLLALAIVFLSGNIAFSGIAILISARTSNSRIGTGLINVITMPMTVLSGVFFSYHNFPDSVIPIIEKMPLTMMADSLRGVFIEGFGIAQVAVNSAILSSLGIICFLIGLRIYKWY